MAEHALKKFIEADKSTSATVTSLVPVPEKTVDLRVYSDSEDYVASPSDDGSGDDSDSGSGRSWKIGKHVSKKSARPEKTRKRYSTPRPFVIHLIPGKKSPLRIFAFGSETAGLKGMMVVTLVVFNYQTGKWYTVGGTMSEDMLFEGAPGINPKRTDCLNCKDMLKKHSDTGFLRGADFSPEKKPVNISKAMQPGSDLYNMCKKLYHGAFPYKLASAVLYRSEKGFDLAVKIALESTSAVLQSVANISVDDTIILVDNYSPLISILFKKER